MASRKYLVVSQTQDSRNLLASVVHSLFSEVEPVPGWSRELSPQLGNRLVCFLRGPMEVLNSDVRAVVRLGSGPATAKEMSDYLRLGSPSRGRYQCNRLVEMGMAEKHEEVRSNKLRVSYQLTDRGRRLFHERGRVINGSTAVR